jgi:hypothetical protein
VVVFGLLDHVATDDGLVAVVIVGFVCDEVGFAKELLLVILEFADHFGGWRLKLGSGVGMYMQGY